MVTFPMPLTDGFQGHSIFEVEYLKNGVFESQSYYRTLIGGFQCQDIFDIEYLIVTRTSIGSHMRLSIGLTV